MDTGEGFAWFFFIVALTILFFAAFGASNVTDASIEEYMQRLISGEGKK